MAFDRQATGLTITRICLGLFFLGEALSKVRWFVDTSLLSRQFGEWMQTAGPASHWYLERIAVPWTAYFARLVPLGELTSGVALLVGLWTPLFAFLAFFMTLNFHFAAGTLFKFSFLTNGYGLPVLGSTLGLAIGGVRLPWSVRR
jgi:uncharacterized membrane protein YphA (DoxX/SURF4 family)